MLVYLSSNFLPEILNTRWKQTRDGGTKTTINNMIWLKPQTWFYDGFQYINQN